jgi:hypothetical protein
VPRHPPSTSTSRRRVASYRSSLCRAQGPEAVSAPSTRSLQPSEGPPPWSLRRGMGTRTVAWSVWNRHGCPGPRVLVASCSSVVAAVTAKTGARWHRARGWRVR